MDGKKIDGNKLEGTKPRSGFTLFEMMIALAIAAILFTQVLPSFSQLIRSSHLSVQKNSFLGAMQFARSEAIKRGQRVYICAGGDLTCSEEDIWEQGWIVFVDADADSEPDPSEILRVFDGFSPSYTLRSNSNTHTLQFLANGRLRRASGALPMMTFHLCAPDAQPGYMAERAYEIVINAGGRLRVHAGVEGETQCA